MILYDTSAVLMDLAEGKLLSGYILDLTIYEVANALRTAVQVKRIMSTAQANAILRAFVLQDLHVLRIQPEHLAEIERLALELNITAYDAAYIYFALKNNLDLYTRDRKLQRAWKRARSNND